MLKLPTIILTLIRRNSLQISRAKRSLEMVTLPCKTREKAALMTKSWMKRTAQKVRTTRKAKEKRLRLARN